jgi:hypothetical protein
MLGNSRQRGLRRRAAGLTAIVERHGLPVVRAIPRSGAAVGLEDFLPALIDRLAIVQILLI